MASKLDDLLGSVVDRLKSVGIGVKNKYDIEAETDPYIRYIRTGGYVRGEPFTPEIAEARRRYMARKKAQQTAAPQDYRTPSNIQAQAGQGTIGDEVSYYDFSDSTPMPRASTGGMGGYSQGGLFNREPSFSYPGDEMTRTWEKAGSPGKRTTSWDRESQLTADDGQDLSGGLMPYSPVVNALQVQKTINAIGSAQAKDQMESPIHAGTGREDVYFGAKSPGDEMTAAYEAEALRRRREEAPYDLVTAATGRNPTVVGSDYPARDFSRDPYLGGAGSGGSELTRYAQRQAELNSASMDMPRGLFGDTWSTSTGTAPYSAERNWGQPGAYIGGGSVGEEIERARQAQARLESGGMDFETPFRGGTYTTTTGTDTQAPVTNWGQTAFPSIGQGGAGGDEISRAMAAVPSSRAEIVEEMTPENTGSFIKVSLNEAGINDPNIIRATLAAVSKESQFIPTAEDLTYRSLSLSGLRNKFKGLKNIPDTTINSIRKWWEKDKAGKWIHSEDKRIKAQKDFAELVYNSDAKPELGNTKKGDAWKYRGRGFVQLTGKANYQDMQKELEKAGLLKGKENIVTDPDLLIKRPELSIFVTSKFIEKNKNKYVKKLNMNPNKLSAKDSEILVASIIYGKDVRKDKVGLAELEKIRANLRMLNPKFKQLGV